MVFGFLRVIAVVAPVIPDAQGDIVGDVGEELAGEIFSLLVFVVVFPARRVAPFAAEDWNWFFRAGAYLRMRRRTLRYSSSTVSGALWRYGCTLTASKNSSRRLSCIPRERQVDGRAGGADEGFMADGGLRIADFRGDGFG